MQDKATTMGLPAVDAEFLRAERLHTLRTEVEHARQQAKAEAEAKQRSQEEQRQRLVNYRRCFEELLLSTLTTPPLSQDAGIFRQSALGQLATAAYTQGRLAQAREFYRLSQPEIDTLEKAVLDELYLLSDLL
jgi:hypothetical protein